VDQERLNETATRVTQGLNRAWQRVVHLLAAGWAQLQEDVRARFVPWLRHRYAVERARGRMWAASVSHGVAVLRCRIEVLRASHAYRARCREARKAADAVEQQEAALVARANEQFHEACRPQRLAGYGPYSLLDDGLVGPDWEVSLPSVRAVVVPPKAVVLKAGGTPRLRVPAEPAPSRRGRLLIRSRRGLSTVDCPPEDPKAREFAQLVNVAALNPQWFQENRQEQIQQAVDQLEAVRALAAQRISEGRAELERVVASTERVEEAQRRLRATARDTRERDRRRAALVTIKRSAPQR
jgi:hypothetical protein